LIRERIAEFSRQKSPIKGDGEYVKSQLFKKGLNREKDSATLIDTPVFGILQCQDKICAVILPSSEFPITNQSADAIGEPTRSYPVLHNRGNLSVNENFINGLESFITYTRKRLMKFHGIPESTFYLHLKNEDIYPILLNIIRNNPLC
jgi:hypothetical protein